MLPSVSIIILCLNRIKYTKRCLESIRRNTKSKYQLVVIDNGSSDGTSEYVKTVLKDKDILRTLPENIGFGPGNNLGVSLCEHEYVCLLNNDTEVKEGWLESLFDALLKRGGMVGPSVAKVLEDEKNKMFYPAGAGKLNIDPWSYLEGWCILMKKETFLFLDCFDPLFDPYLCEDSDLSFKCRKAGLNLTEAGVNKILHNGDKTVPVHLQTDISKDHNKKLCGKWKNNKSYLFERRGARGDVLLMSPIFRRLKKKYPNCSIGVRTVVPDFVSRKYVDRIFHWEMGVRKEEFDVILSPTYEKKNHHNYIECMAECAGLSGEIKDRRLDFDLEEETVKWAEEKLSSKSVCFHIGSSWKSREWNIENFKKVASDLKEKGYEVLELGDQHTPFMGIGTDFRGIPIQNTAAIIKKSVLLIGIDSLLIHIAAAVETPVIGIYGCTKPNVVWSSGKHYPVWNEQLSCKGCRHGEKGDLTFIECSNKLDCLNTIKANDVLFAFKLFERENGNG